MLDALEAGYFRADVTEQARAALDLAANSADGIALTYTLNAPLLVSARTGWTLQENALRIELQNVREEILAGEAYADAVVLLDGREIARTLLTAQAVEAPPEETPAPEFAETRSRTTPNPPSHRRTFTSPRRTTAMAGRFGRSPASSARPPCSSFWA